MGALKRAIAWSAIDNFGRQAAQFLLYVVLARLLSPAEYGLVGMLAIFIGVALVFADSGLSTGLVQRPTLTDNDETTVFWLNIATGLLLTLLLCAIAPWVAAFYRQPILVPLLCLMSLQFILSAFGIVQCALLMRTMDFRRLAIINTLSMILSGVVAIGMALAGLGVWSLAGQALSGALVRSGLAWSFSPWRPRGRFSLASMRKIWSFSSNLLIAGLICQFFENLYSATIGKVYSAAELGYFTRANQMQTFPAATITGIINRVSFPLFSRLQNDPAALCIALRRAIRLSLVLTVFVLAALAVTADQVVVLLLTKKWEGCVPLARVLVLGGILLPLHILHLSALTAMGRSGVFLWLEIAKRTLQAAALAATWRLGTLGMVWGCAALSVVAYFINSVYNVRLLGYTWRQQAVDVLPILMVGGVAAAMAWETRPLLSSGLWMALSVQLAVFGAVFAGIAFLLRRRAFADAWHILTEGAAWVSARGLGSVRKTV